MVLHQRETVVIGEIDVGLINQEQPGKPPGQLGHFCRRDERAAGSVWIRQINRTRFRSDGIRHGLQVKRKVSLRHQHQLGPARANGHRERRVRSFRRQPLKSSSQERPRRKINKLARPQSNKNLFRRNTPPLRQSLPQCVRAPIRIAVRIPQHRTRRHHGLRRRPQRVLIRSELHRMNLQLPLHFFNGFSRNIHGQPAKVIRYEVFNRLRHLSSLLLQLFCRQSTFTRGGHSLTVRDSSVAPLPGPSVHDIFPEEHPGPAAQVARV